MPLPSVWVPYSQSMLYHGCLYLLWGECLPRSKGVILHMYLFFPFFSSISSPPFFPPFLSVLHAHTAIRTLCLVLSNSPSPKKREKRVVLFLPACECSSFVAGRRGWGWQCHSHSWSHVTCGHRPYLTCGQEHLAAWPLSSECGVGLKRVCVIL